MKKLFLMLMVSVMSMLIITSCGNDTVPSVLPTATPENTQQQATQMPNNNTQTEQFIGEDRAKEIALERAGLTETDVSFVKVELDRDDGVWKYEIDFRQSRTEYETDINALDGTILAWETDKD